MLVSLLAIAAIAAPVAGENHEAGSGAALCRLCGRKYPDARALLRNTCPRNHGGKHVLFEGEAAEKYICENCGMTYASLKDLTRNTCPHGNGAAHVPYHGGIKAEYTCRWCEIVESSGIPAPSPSTQVFSLLP